MNTIQNLQRDFEEQAISWGEALKIGDHRTANRKNSAITKIAKRFKKDRNLGEVILVPLLKHTNPSVRLMASVHALDLEIHLQEAEDVLTQVAGDSNIHVVQLMAQINLQMWNEKKIAEIYHLRKTSRPIFTSQPVFVGGSMIVAQDSWSKSGP